MPGDEPSERLHHYRLAEKIGEGGMGVVWRAFDTHLDREVAIKVLPAELASDADRLARLEREAKLLASVSHANICAVYGLEESDGTRFLVMELVAGEDLSDRLAHGRLGVAETLDVCGQIAAALEAAHDQGVVHRDLKPANVRVTPEGVVKVLDFGLARPGLGPSALGDPSISPTITAMTGSPGVLLGTASYMSSEQARGLPVDRRADIWALGCVMYECLTGRRAFEGETVSDTLAEILKSTPDWSALPADTPPRLCELIERCLAKDSRERQRDAGDVRLALRRIAVAGSQSPAGAEIGGTAPARKTLLAVGAAALITGALLGVGLWRALSDAPSSAPRRVARLSVPIPEGQQVRYFYLSPDGSHLAYIADDDSSEQPRVESRRLYVRPLDAYEARPVESSAGVRRAAFSPDGRWLAFVARESPHSARMRLSKVPVDGSAPPLRLADWEEAWSWDFVWTTSENLVAVSFPPQRVIEIAADGSGVETTTDIEMHQSGALLTAIARLDGGTNVLCRGQISDEEGYREGVFLLNVETGAARILVEHGSHPRWLPSGYLLFTRTDTLLAAPFDSRRLEVTASPRAITRGLGGGRAFSGAWFDLSRDGSLVYQPGGVIGSRRRLASIGIDGTVEDWSSETRPLAALRASADGRWIAVQVVGQTGRNDEVWVADSSQPPLRRLIFEQGLDCGPGAISASGRIAALCITASGDRSGVVFHDADGGGDSAFVAERATDQWTEPLAFVPNGSRLVFSRWVGESVNLYDQAVAAMGDGEANERLLLNAVEQAWLSPDGRWLAYVSAASGQQQAYLRSYEPVTGIGSEIPVTTDGASWVRWSPAGVEGRQRLFFVTPDGLVRSVVVDAAVMPRLSAPESYPELSESLRDAVDYQPIAADRWIAVVRGEDEKPATELRVILNWADELN